MRWWKSPSAEAFRIIAMLALPLAGAAPSMAIAQAIAQPRHEVIVTIHGAAGISAHLRQAMPGHIARALAGRPLQGYPAGTRLVITIDEVYLSQDGNMPYGSLGDFAAMPDTISGSMRLLDNRGGVGFARDLVVSIPPDSGGFGPGNERRRVEALMAAMAQWAARYANR